MICIFLLNYMIVIHTQRYQISPQLDFLGVLGFWGFGVLGFWGLG